MATTSESPDLVRLVHLCRITRSIEKGQSEITERSWCDCAEWSLVTGCVTAYLAIRGSIRRYVLKFISRSVFQSTARVHLWWPILPSGCLSR